MNPEILAAIDELRRVGQRYPQFSLFGILAALGGYKNATPEMLVEARDALERVVNLTGDNQFSDDPLEIERLRRVAGDTPIAPYNILAVSAMRGDFALRTGDLEAARRHYYTAIHANHAYRWPWRAEVESRLATMETVRDAFETKPARTFMLCFRAHGDIGVQDAIKDEVYGGRVGNGSCTICHTHVSTFDLPAMHANASAEPAPQIGWIRGRIAAPADIRQPVPTVFALPKPSESEIPTGFYIGLTLPPGVNPEFYRDDSLYRGEFVLPAKPGDVYVAARLRGKTTQQKEGMLKGLAKTRIGLPWAIPVEAGKVTDIREHPITLIAH